MTTISEKEKLTELRKKLSLELCDNFTKRLNPFQKKEIKIGAIIAIKNFIKESKIDDPIIYSFLVDAITDHKKDVRGWVSKVIKDIGAGFVSAQNLHFHKEITELLELKLKENISEEIKEDIIELIKS